MQLGTIDSGYRGEVKVIVDNIAKDDSWGVGHYLGIDGNPLTDINGYEGHDYTYLIRKGTRIAQAVFAPVETCNFIDADKLEETMRGAGGFGSTGVKEAE